MRVLALILCCLFIYTTATGQETRSRLPELDRLVGTWDVTAESRLSAAGPWETNKGRSTIVKTNGGTVIEEDYLGRLQKKPFSTKTLIAFDRLTNRFERTFIDSEHGALVSYDGDLLDGTLTFDKDFTYPNGSKVSLRVVYTFVSPDEFKVENMRMPEDATSWDVTGRSRYVRANRK